MTFYLGDSIAKLDLKEKNVELDDDLYQFIYDSRARLEISLQVLFEFDQYSDVLITLDKVEGLEKACISLLNSNILTEYEDHDEAHATIMELIGICKEACTKRVGLISIGD